MGEPGGTGRPPGGPAAAPGAPAGRSGAPVGTLPPHLDPRGPARRPAAPRRRHGTPARVLRALAAVCSLLVLVGSGTLYFGYRHYEGRINRINPFERLQDRPQAAPGRAQNYLLVGSDTRSGAGDAVYGRGIEGARSDTIVLVHLSAKQDKALLISFPRDSYVDIPSCRDARGRTLQATKNKINSAYARGGAACTIATIEKVTDVRIDHYIEVDFAGFKRMVDALGGVDVCLPRAVKDKDSKLDLPKGVSHVSGDQALAFVRARKIDNDLGRIKRQQQFMGSMLKRATSTGTLLNPFKLKRFLDVVTASVTTDSELSAANVRTLASKLRGLDPGRVTFVTVPITDDDYRPSKAVGSTVLWDEAGAQALFRSIREDSRVPGASPAPSPVPNDLIVAPSKIRVRVLNGAGTAGLARRAANDLAKAGFQVTGTGNADASDYDETVVRYGPTRADSARTLAAALPGSTMQDDVSLGRTLEVVVGRSYSGARSVTVQGSSAQGSPSPGASGKPKTRTAADNPCT